MWLSSAEAALALVACGRIGGEELRDTADRGGTDPQWLADTAQQAWSLHLAGRAMDGSVLVCEASP
ncbi:MULTISPECIES: hypothetical protein [unclassified Streptomyces]|uniref:hypothetical protein n=1 Tax=unclassified Streptomyces TaxID=2593676 RepID=UPI00131BC66E|nr:hypothetical protein [Streptomyces sp. CB01635]